jgi:hypothetical protein
MANQINLDLLWARLGGKTDPTDNKWEGGWVAEIPTYQNFNYVLHALDSNLLHLAENGAFQWQTEINYGKGTFVREGGFEWFCITPNSGNRPSDDATNSYWTTGKIIGRNPATPYTQKHGVYVANVNDRTLTTWTGNDITLENKTCLVAFNSTNAATGNMIFGNVGGELVVVDVGTTVVPDGRTLALENDKVHKIFHEGYPPNQTQVAGTVPEAPNDGLLYSRKNKNWVKSSSTDVQGQPPPAVRGAGGGWFNLDDGQLYLDINDGDSSQWVPACPPIIPARSDDVNVGLFGGKAGAIIAQGYSKSGGGFRFLLTHSVKVVPNQPVFSGTYSLVTTQLVQVVANIPASDFSLEDSTGKVAYINIANVGTLTEDKPYLLRCNENGSTIEIK